MKLISTDQIRRLHKKNIEITGGETGILRPDQLETLGNQLDMYLVYASPTVIEVAGWYLQRLIQNHYFVDGNKRVAITTSIAFLELNGLILVDNIEEILYELCISIANGDLSELEMISEKLKSFVK